MLRFVFDQLRKTVRRQVVPTKYTISCPAKINLFLSVGPPDARGYHPLRTVFQAIGLFDTLEVEVDAPSSFSCSDPAVPPLNTVTRALALASERFKIPSMAVRLTKRIPAESGLGGGSSDAAAMLRLISLVVRGFDAVIHELALKVGADVPFFLVGGRARGEGYGQILAPLPDGEPDWIVVARPEIGCPTPEAFRRLDARDRSWRDFPSTDELYNDFELVAPSASLDLIVRLRELGARDAALSGSGSAVFGRFVDLALAESAAERMRLEGTPHVWVAPTLTRAKSLAI